MCRGFVNFLWIMCLCWAGMLYAGIVDFCYSDQTVQIRFPEPVVQASDVWDDEEDEGKSAPDLFRITGDSRHTPQTRWLDQNKLEICFPDGSSCRTQYKLTFHSGTRYLGGAEMKKREYVFRCPYNHLCATPIATAAGCAVLVTTKNHHTLEAQQFSEKTAVSYVFRKVKKSIWTGERYLGRSVAATVEPARVCDGVLEESLKRLAASGQKVWGKLKPGSLLPGHVLVRPVEELDMDETWVLCYSGAPQSGIIDGRPEQNPGCPPWLRGESADFHPVNELLSGVSVAESVEKTGELEMTVFFSQPLPEKMLPTLFSRLQFSLDGEGQMENTKEGRKLTRDKVWLLFRYAGVIPYAAHGVDLPGQSERKLAYQAAGLAVGMRIRVSGVLPAVVDVGIPAGTAAANGAATREEHVHRLALNSAWPQIPLDTKTPMVLPLKGSHKLRLPTANISAVKATVRCVHPQQTAALLMSAAYDSRDRDKAQYKYRIHRERKRRDFLPVSSTVESLEKTLDSEEEQLEYREECRRRWMADAKAYREHHFDLKGSSLFRSSELVLDLEALTGEKLNPGLYMVTLKVTPNAHVQYALSLQGQKADSLNYELDVPVLVTDLNVICSAQGVLVTRFSDGTVVADAELKAMEWNESADVYEEESLPDCSGVAIVRKGTARNVIARSGQDIAYGHIPSDHEQWGVADANRQKYADRIFLLKDRPMYRPGDTVHVRGLLRRFRHEHFILSPEKKVKMVFCRPNGEKIKEETLKVNAFGAFSADYTLPEGEEDVTGDFYVEVRVGSASEKLEIPCMVFRRNAFVATMTVDAEQIAPEKIKLKVQADDYSGVPLSNAKVELKIASFDATETHHLKTDACGTAVLELPMKPEWLRAGEIGAEGSVCNDREEYVVLPLQMKKFSSADFNIAYRDSLIYLTDATTDAPLNRDQRISIVLKAEGLKPLNSRSCFTVMEPLEKTVTGCELTIPANCRQGVPLPPKILKKLQEFASSDNENRKKLTIELRGSDSAGREELCRISSPFSDPAVETKIFLRAEPTDEGLRVHFLSPRKGPVHVFIGCGERLRHVQKRAEQGEQTLDVKLQRLEAGTVSVSLILPELGRHATRRLISDETTCFVPVKRQHLDVSLHLPQEASRPGQKMVLSGQVLVEGKPAEAEVTLYAVDAGMLSLSEYVKPDPERFFASDKALTFQPVASVESPPVLSDELMDAVWMGELLRGDSVSLSPQLRKKFYSGAELNEMAAYDGILTGGLRSGSGALSASDMSDGMVVADGELPPWLLEPSPVAPITDEEEESVVFRNDFEPVAVWKAALRTDAEGRFSAEAELPDTLTTYRVFAVAAERSGSRFGSAEGSFVVNLPVMITPGMPLFMSTGDSLKLPLSITNATTESGVWTVTLEGCETPQQVELQAGGSATLYFDVSPTQEGECRLRWSAVGAPGMDAVQGTCKVRFPAPLLKEIHRVELAPGQEPLKPASLFAPELAESSRSESEVWLSSSPLLHLRGCLDFLLSYPYGCTEQKASALMPRLLYDELAPFCPQLAATPGDEVKKEVEREIRALFARQCEDGGLGYWQAGKSGCGWASAYAALVLTVASERGYTLPQDRMQRLLRYVDRLNDKELFFDADLMAARALGENRRLERILKKKCESVEELKKAGIRPGVYGATLNFLKTSRAGEKVGEAFRDWLRTVARDARHNSTAHSTLMLLALHDFLRKQSVYEPEVAVVTDSGRYLLKREPFKLPLPEVGNLAELPTSLSAEGGPVYVLVQAKAQPEKTEFSGVTEKGLQVTRIYEVKGEDGKWHQAPEQLKVGDVVRVTLTCAKVEDTLEYFVLEDYLPACMEAINPEIPSQAVGTEPVPWSRSFDYREYLTDRVRGFCTRWSGRDLLNMTYFARVKRAGISTAPPAQAQLMYEPQVYGLSPNFRVISIPAE